ncbi:MAG: UDP-glucose/GDP-mannose dehydrogenase family protein [Alphaproteobacteria bacterium]|nr:UDP-glucose/GDP-mannose dehydrogenase family protein [Alphaproteobacteria bacterium]NCQ87676.1 UDP-glucose/GDP-mannose dehydrogenase family protein [Alphaproteobacteria bacterium]NCT05815.1 UDP-glucose/GDP-mannose dehydrogenase family protein [Alphaproteobacteria bacterium]
MKISVFGIGYVGAVTSACLCDTGHTVIAVDKDPVKVQCLNDGRSPIIEKDLDTLIKKYTDSGMLTATLDIKEAVAQSDISLICVGTPSREDGSLDLAYIEDVCQEMGEVIKTKDAYHTVVLRSTMVPGTAMDLCLPILEKASGKKAGKDFGFGNNPEFLRESTAIYDYYNPPKIVVGGIDEKSADMIMGLYEGIEAPRIKTDINVAEGVKYADNAWHAMKVGFANEIGNILSDCGVDSHKVMDIFCMDTKLNISTAYMKPGFAFGGSCLPKDVRAIRAKGKSTGLKTPIFDALLEANENQVTRAFEKIKASGKKHVGMMGLSFKSGTDDLRESPLVTLANQLLDAGFTLSVYDPNVFHASRVECANQNYINNVITHISKNLVETPEQLKEKSEIYVIGNNGEQFSKIIQSIDDTKIPVLDLVRIDPAIESREGYHGICW